ncbi:MAG TPA: methylenetetrahydrofolate reductase C-terminal domain-containing protein [Anaerolineae bacterium]|nr:methylenetetrahydrofolate reductase C-terminal domain-containing protein [Anaerolineae bacterium]
MKIGDASLELVQRVSQRLLRNRPKMVKQLERVLVPAEEVIKKPIWGCQMCGQCILHDTGLTCPMGCPKNLRNGPCGGVRPDGMCEVDATKPCVWALGYKRSQKLPWAEHFYQLNPPVDWTLRGSSSWINLVLQRDHRDLIQPRWNGNTLEWKNKPLRTGSKLERRLRAGQFAVTVEIDPPNDVGIDEFIRTARALAPMVDGMNITDNTRATIHMSSLAAAALLTHEGLEPVMQITCRDRNQLALQSDLLGASALGIQNVLCLTGDYPTLGDHKWAKPVFDIDSVNLIRYARQMCDQAIYMNRQPIKNPPRLFIGGADAPLTEPRDFRPHRLAKKVAAGVDFVQSQLIFDIAGLRQYMQNVRDMGLDKHVAILIGVGVLPGPKTARMINENVPGLEIPEWVIERMERLPKEKHRDEGIAIAIEMVQQIREIEGVAGIHLTAMFQKGKAEAIQAIGEAVGFLPREPLPDLLELPVMVSAPAIVPAAE